MKYNNKFINILLISAAILIFKSIVYSENELVKGTPLDILQLFNIETIIIFSIIFSVILYFDYKNRYIMRKSIFIYIIIIFLIRSSLVVILPNLWYVEEYWRVGRSYEAAVQGHLKMSGLNEENPIPILFMSIYLKIFNMNWYLTTKLFDLFEIIIIFIIVFIIIFTSYNEKRGLLSILLFGIIYIELGHFSRQDYAFLIYLYIIYLLFKDIKYSKSLNLKEILVINLFLSVLVLSHPAYPLILILNIVILLLFNKIYLNYISRKYKDNNSSILHYQYSSIYRFSVYILLFIIIFWSAWHLILGANNFDMIKVLYNSFHSIINLLSEYGFSNKAIIASRQISYISINYHMILLIKQIFIILSVLLSFLIFIFSLLKFIKYKEHRYWHINLLAFYISNIIILIMIAYSGHVPLRGTLMVSLSIVLIIPLLVKYNGKINRFLYILTTVFLAIGLLLSPLLTYSPMPLVYADTSELYLTKYSISYYNYLSYNKIYVLEYNGPQLGYFFNSGLEEIHVYIPPNNKYLNNIFAGKYLPLQITHRILFRDNFFIYNMNLRDVTIKSYNELYNLLFNFTKTKFSIIYYDSFNNLILI